MLVGVEAAVDKDLGMRLPAKTKRKKTRRKRNEKKERELKKKVEGTCTQREVRTRWWNQELLSSASRAEIYTKHNQLR